MEERKMKLLTSILPLFDFLTACSQQVDREKLNDEDLAAFLAVNVHQSVADVMLKWDE